MKKIHAVLFSRDSSPPGVNSGEGWRLEDARSWLESRGMSAAISEGEVELRSVQFPAEEIHGSPMLGAPGSGSESDPPLGVRYVEAERRSRRSLSKQPVEYRAVPGIVTAEDRAISGLGVPYGVATEIFSGFTEEFEPGSFDADLRNLADRSVFSYFNHDRNVVLGSTRNETLELESRSDGLFYRIPSIVKTRAAEDVLELVASREVQGSSIGFRAVREREIIDEDGDFHRVVVEAQLFDVGPVTEPAYPSTSAEARARGKLEALAALDFVPCAVSMRDQGLTVSQIEGRVRAARDRWEIPRSARSSISRLEAMRLRLKQLEAEGRTAA